jgi:site-specific recombinase XerD
MEGGNHEDDVYEQGERQEEPTQIQAWHTRSGTLKSGSPPEPRFSGLAARNQHAIDEFVAWYCSEPRLAFNKTVVLRYRFSLEERGLASGTINVRMAAVRRLAYEAAESGLLSPELAASIHRVKGVLKLGSRLGNWLTAGEASALWQVPDARTPTGKRNRAILAILLGYGLRRRKLAELTLESFQRREERWVIVDPVGKGRHIRTVPVPYWVKETLDRWLAQPISQVVRYSDVSVGRLNSGDTAFQKRRSGTLSRRLRRE